MRARVGRSAGRGRDARHAPARSRGALPRGGVRRRRRRARGAHVRDRRPRGRGAHAAGRARPSGSVRVPDARPSRYFGGDDALAARVHDAVATALGAPDGDRRPGRHRRRRVRRPARGAGGPRGAVRRGAGRVGRVLRAVAGAVLGDDELASLLVRLGLPTAGRRRRPRRPSAVLARFGAEGRRFHDLARGSTPGRPCSSPRRPISSSRPSSIRPAERVDVAAFAAKGLADRLLARLAERGLACTRVVIEAETEHGERLTRCWRHDRVLTPRRAGRTGALAARRLAGSCHDRRRRSRRHDGRAHAAAAGSRRGRARRRSPARLLGWRPGCARPRRPRARARAGHARLRRGRHRGRAAGARPAEQVRWVPWGEAREPQRPLVVDRSSPRGRVRCRRRSRRACSTRPSRRAVDAPAHAVAVSGGGEQSASAGALRVRDVAGRRRRGRGWAGPWAHDVRWWDPPARRRCARWQVVVDCADAGTVACVVVVESGRAGVEAIYD